MIHYTCDRCKRNIDTSEQTRYVVQIEVQPTAEDPIGCEIDDDIDHLTELHQILEGISVDELQCGSSESSHRGRYDLCPECYRQFLKNPLGRDATLAIGFSNN